MPNVSLLILVICVCLGFYPGSSGFLSASFGRANGRTMNPQKDPPPISTISSMSADIAGTSPTLQKPSNAQQAAALSIRIKRDCRTPAAAMETMRPHIIENNNDGDKNHQISDWEEAWFAVLQICGKHKDYLEAIRIVKKYCGRSDRCRSLAIAICGRCHQMEQALSLLLVDTTENTDDKVNNDNNIISTPAPYNAAIAACGTNRAWKDALIIVQRTMPRSFVTSLTCNAVLMALVKCRRCDETLDFLRQGFDDLGIVRDRRSYHHGIAVLISQGKLDDAVRLVLQDMAEEGRTNPEAIPNQETYTRLTSTLVTKCRILGEDLEEKKVDKSIDEANVDILQQELQSNRDMLQHIQEAAVKASRSVSNQDKRKKRKRTDESETSLLPTDGKRAKYTTVWNFCKWTLPKRGNGKTAFWQLGIIDDNDNKAGGKKEDAIIVGLHPNRNPSQNGIQLWLFRDPKDGSNKLQKLGYLLMINTPSYDADGDSATAGTSQFLGLCVTDDVRRGGLAKAFVAIWLQCCLDANLQPTTGRMNKPLLCLVLQHSFGFLPVELSGGVRAKLLPPAEHSSDDGGDDDGEEANNTRVVRLTTVSSAVKNLAGALTPRDLQEQNIQLVAPSAVTKREHELGRPIEVGGLLRAPANLEEYVHTALQDRWKLSPEVLTHSRTGTAAATGRSDIEKPLTMAKLFLGL